MSEEKTEHSEPVNESDRDKKGGEKPRKKRRLWPWVLLLVFGSLLIGGYSFYEYSNTPGFCRTCHIMEPYFDAWETSQHSHIACVECHIAPNPGAKWQKKIQGMIMALKYVTRTYGTKPFAEIEDASCLRSGCHEQRLVQEHSTETFKNNVVFDHGTHLEGQRRGKELRCTSCHAQIVVGNHMEVTTSTCYLCHFKESDQHDITELSDCRLCHKQLPDEDVEHQVRDPHDPSVVLDTVSFNHTDYIGDRSLSCTSCHFDVVSGQGEAKENRCYVCHNEPEVLARFTDIEFIHNNHITEHNITCERCHDQIKHAVNAAPPSVENHCSTCHNDLHGGQRKMYMGIGGKGVDEPMPGSMYAAMVDCTGCHIVDLEAASKTRFTGFTRPIDNEGCIRCHGDLGEDYIDVYNSYADEVKERLAGLKRSLATAQRRSGLSDDQKKSLEDAAYNIEFVEKARGWAHNWDYAGALLDHAEEILDSLQ